MNNDDELTLDWIVQADTPVENVIGAFSNRRNFDAARDGDGYPVEDGQHIPYAMISWSEASALLTHLKAETARADAAEARAARLTEACLEARSVFQEYVRLHHAKNPPDEEKAQRNFAMADMLGNALAGLPSQAAPGGGEWRTIDTLSENSDPLILAATKDGRMMIFSREILLTAMSERTPNHLRFPATHWRPLPSPPRSTET